MSRPPRPHFRLPGDAQLEGRLGGARPGLDGMLALQRRLAEQELSLASGGEGEFAATLMEASALLAQVLAAHQGAYAREAYLGTAEEPRSLVRHARRLAYAPDLGRSAVGYLALTIGEGLAGRIPAGFAMASAPRGETPPEDYETLEDLDVDAAWNEMRPLDALIPARVCFDSAGEATLTLAGTGHGLEKEQQVLLAWHEHGSDAESPPPHALILSLKDCREDRKRRETSLVVANGPADETVPKGPALGDPPRVLAAPGRRLHLFGWDADPIQYPSDRILAAGAYVSAGAETCGCAYGYQVEGDYDEHDVYLDAELSKTLADTWVAVWSDGAWSPRLVVSERATRLTLRRCRVIEQPVPRFLASLGEESDRKLEDLREDAPTKAMELPSSEKALPKAEVSTADTAAYKARPEEPPAGGRPAPRDDSDETSHVEVTIQKQVLETGLAGTVSCLRLRSADDATLLKRSDLPLAEPILAGWQVQVPLVDPAPSPDPIASPLILEVAPAGLRPGRRMLFTDLAETRAQLVELTRIDPSDEAHVAIEWRALTETDDAPAWELGDLKVLGNLARISHGKRVQEVLGDSDGVTPFLRFRLRKSPLTMLQGGGDLVPDLEVRVDQVAWSRVPDFEQSGSLDRHFLVELDQDRVASVIFGDGRKGAIPAAGKRHISAGYRVGVGACGNAAPRSIQRIKQAHPLVKRAHNPVAVAHGADAASPEDMRTQATRWVRTFDRAVSVQDHADLALLYPGVVQATARWTDRGGIELVAVGADGEAPPAEDLLAFLDPRRDESLLLRLVDPVRVEIELHLTVDFDPARLPENVRIGVQAALCGTGADTPGLFTLGARKLGQAAHLSEVHAAVARVPGVLSASVERFCLTGHETGVFDLLEVAPDQWLALDCGTHLSIALSAGGRS